ncbi:CoA-transferase [Arsenicitalea aurantiaca]|uniref:CoA-transferase n=1 Tax=Arsenicitalea aurantiaca TaxID=1783274 RepID=A0A433XEH9_9HYPH|nr:CoA-transferase [Arsenicitalea aurantiaca]RUT32493.1 CoA-transferase [Arsenicitalea aurantiaca]
MTLSSASRSLARSNTPAFETLQCLAARVKSGSRLGIGGHHFARLPMALLREVIGNGARDLHYFAWAGGLPLEMLLEADAVRAIDLCFSSLDIFGLAPRFRVAAETGTIPVTDWPALAMIEAFNARRQNLPFMPVQIPAGSTMAERCPALSFHRDPQSGRLVGLVAAQELDTVLIHAPRADRSGNVEIVGARALDLAIVGAARQVLVTVDEIVEDGSLGQSGRHAIITRNLVTAIAEVPGGAWPTSCLPHYVTDYAAIASALGESAGSLLDRLACPQGEPGAYLCNAALLSAVDPEPFRAPALDAARPATIDEIMATRIAMLLDNESFASSGAVSPLANVAYRLAKASHAPRALLTTFTCGHVDIAPGTMTLSLLEPMDAASAVAHCGGDDTYFAYYQAGLVTHEIIGAAQVDGAGRTNNLELTKPSGGKLRLPGQGGMSDVANMHANYIVYVPRHSPSALVREVETISSARGVLSADDREAAGYRQGTVLLLTNLCLFRLDPETGHFAVVEIMPGASREEIVAETGFPIVFDPDCVTWSGPDLEQLRLLREEIDPLGLRRLEFVGARDRAPLLAEILERDRKGTAALIARRA